MDSGTFKLLAILILAIGFTVGAGFGVFNFDFGSITNSTASAIVTDTAFPDVDDIQVNTTAKNTNVTSDNQVVTTEYTQSQSSYDSNSYVAPVEPTPSDGGGGSSEGGTPEPTPTNNP
jgi:hypothetical protein